MKTMGPFISAVYVALTNNESSTAGELFAKYYGDYPNTKRSRGEVSKRLADLRNMGLAFMDGVKVCSYSGHSASTWKSLPLHNGLEISGQYAEDRLDYPTTCCRCCCGDDSHDEGGGCGVETMHDTTSDEKCVDVDDDDIQFLKSMRASAESISSNPLSRILVMCVPGMKGKVAKLKKALRYF